MRHKEIWGRYRTELKDVKTINKMLDEAISTEKDRILRIVRTHPVGNLIMMDCTNHEGFARFINTFVTRMVKSIENVKGEDHEEK